MKRVFFVIAVMLGMIIAMPAIAAPAKAKAPREPKEDQYRPTKIGIIDMQKILQESKVCQKSRNAFMKDLEVKKDQLMEKAKLIQKQEEELNRLDPGVSAEVRRQKTDKLKHDTRDLANLRQDAEMEMKQKDVELTRKLVNEIMVVVRNYARSERYSIILERNTIILAEESADITDKIIKLFDAQKK